MNMRNRAFVSYSHADAEYLKRLQVHLAPYIREKKVDAWDDTRIQPGARWKEEIKQAIALARVAILLISADFMASEFIAQNELPPLLASAEQQGTLVLSVILSPSAFKGSKLACYQSLNTPSFPLIDMSRGEQEAIWAKLAKHITDVLAPEPASNSMEDVTNPPYQTNHDSTFTAYIGEGAALRGLQKYDEALIAYEHAIRLDSSSAQAYIGKGNALSGLKRYDEALTAYEQAIHLDPHSSIAYLNKGNVLNKLKRPEEAREAYQQARKLE